MAQVRPVAAPQAPCTRRVQGTGPVVFVEQLVSNKNFKQIDLLLLCRLGWEVADQEDCDLGGLKKGGLSALPIEGEGR